MEMKPLPNPTNGDIILAGSPATPIPFPKQSYLCVFNKDAYGHLEMGFNATFDIHLGSSGLPSPPAKKADASAKILPYFDME